MNGRQRILAALSPEGTPEIPVVIPYEGILIRDHWPALSRAPWWVREDPDLDVQTAWRLRVIEALEQDGFALPACRPAVERRRMRLQPGVGGPALIDSATGRVTSLVEPRVAGWTAADGAQSVHPARPPRAPEDVEAQPSLSPLP